MSASPPVGSVVGSTDLVDKFLPLALFLGQRDEGLACFHAVGPRLLGLVAGAEFVKQAVYQFAAVFHKRL